MEKLTIQDVRRAIYDMHDNELSEIVAEISDDDLLDTSLTEDLMMDSLDVIEMTLEIERLHGISIPDDAYDKVKYKDSKIRTLLDIYNEAI